MIRKRLGLVLASGFHMGVAIGVATPCFLRGEQVQAHHAGACTADDGPCNSLTWPVLGACHTANPLHCDR
jgi:hypothetical protein